MSRNERNASTIADEARLADEARFYDNEDAQLARTLAYEAAAQAEQDAKTTEHYDSDSSTYEPQHDCYFCGSRWDADEISHLYTPVQHPDLPEGELLWDMVYVCDACKQAQQAAGTELLSPTDYWDMVHTLSVESRLS